MSFNLLRRALWNHSLVNVNLHFSERLFVSLQECTQSQPKSLGCKVIHNKTLRYFHWGNLVPGSLGIQAEIENKFFRKARDTSEVRIQRLQAFGFNHRSLKLLSGSRFWGL